MLLEKRITSRTGICAALCSSVSGRFRPGSMALPFSVLMISFGVALPKSNRRDTRNGFMTDPG